MYRAADLLKASLFAALALPLNTPGTIWAQGTLGSKQGPCLTQPKPGVRFTASLSAKVEFGKEGRQVYSWDIKSSPKSEAPLYIAFFRLDGVKFEPIAGWTDAGGNFRWPAGGMLWVEKLDGQSDLKPGGELSIRAEDPRLPGVSMLRLYPRRENTCIPSTPEEEAELARGGWTPEWFAKEFDRLGHINSFTLRVPIIGPVFPRTEGARPEALFAGALRDLRALTAYLAMDYGPDNDPVSPMPKSTGEDPKGLTLEELRAAALKDRSIREEDRPVVQELFRFYAEMRAAEPPKK